MNEVTRSGDAIRVSAKDGVSYAEILKAMKEKVNPQNAGAEVLSIRRTRREEILLFLKKGGDVSAFEKALDQAVGEKADVKSLVSKGSLEARPREPVQAVQALRRCWVGELPHPRACRGCPVLQVPGIWPCVAWLRASRQKGCLLELWGRVARGQGMQGSPSVPDLR